MDPLSIAAAIAGLLSLGGSIASGLFSIVHNTGDAPSLARSVLQEVTDISAILGQLDNFIQGRVTVPQERGSMVPFKHLVVLLSGCVLTYSDLQQQLDKMNLATIAGNMGVLDRLAWVSKKAAVGAIVQRLQNHKASMSLMLIILQCQTSQEAKSCTVQLSRAVEETLRDNKCLSERIKCLEKRGTVYSDSSSSRYTKSRRGLVKNTSLSNDDCATIRTASSRSTVRPFVNNVSMAYQSARAAFEVDLAASRVYQRADRQGCFSMTSLPSTAFYSAALSLLSSLSRDQVSNVSVFALPIFATDLSNSEYYSWPVQQDDVPPNMSKDLGNQKAVSNLSKLKGMISTIKSPPQRPEWRPTLKGVEGERSLAEIDSFRQDALNILASQMTTMNSERSKNLPYLGDHPNTEIEIPSHQTLWLRDNQPL